MGQQEIFTYLKEHKTEWTTARDIARKLNVSFGSATTSLKRLRDTNQVEYKKVPISTEAKRKIFAYRYKK